MKIAAIDTLRLESPSNLPWVEIRTDEGPVGPGETFYGAAQAEAQIHAYVAPLLLGGKVRERVRVYYTCAGPRYGQNRPAQGSENFGIGAAGR